jgi:hypothetical protein
MAKTMPKHRAIDPKGSGRHSADPADPKPVPEKKSHVKGAVKGAVVGGVEGGIVGGLVGSAKKTTSAIGVGTSGNSGMKLLIAEFFICMVILGLSGLSGGSNQQTQPTGPAQNAPAPQGPNQ